MTAPRPRLRDLGIALGRYRTGANNAITDVSGVRVGHCTLHTGEGPLEVGRGPVRTGVTALLPNDGNIFEERLVGGAFVLNGAGEMTGLMQIVEWGLVETPILLTNTLSVGRVAHGVVQHMLEENPEIGVSHDVIIPLVGECDDSFLNDIGGSHVREHHVATAIAAADTGPVLEGAVGAGTGMVAFDLKAGIGTASRVLGPEDGGYMLGVLVNANVGRLEDLRIDGIPAGEATRAALPTWGRRKSLYGSIIVILATDAPLTSHQISRLCKRAALGLGRVGSFAAHGSGEIVLGFSTANRVPRSPRQATISLTSVADRALDPLYRATIETTEEAILNALCVAPTTVGQGGNVAPGMPHDVVRELWRRHRRPVDGANR